jgi:hypothetical protein
MSDLYDTDILLWSEQQAAAIRRRAANEIDWENVAEEIESVGNEQLHAVDMTSRPRHGRFRARCRTGAPRRVATAMTRGGAMRRPCASAST